MATSGDRAGAGAAGGGAKKPFGASGAATGGAAAGGGAGAGAAGEAAAGVLGLWKADRFCATGATSPIIFRTTFIGSRVPIWFIMICSGGTPRTSDTSANSFCHSGLSFLYSSWGDRRSSIETLGTAFAAAAAGACTGGTDAGLPRNQGGSWPGGVGKVAGPSARAVGGGPGTDPGWVGGTPG